MICSFLIASVLISLFKALFDFNNTFLDEPVTHGLYRASRHPQIVISTAVILDASIAVSSWLALAIWPVVRLFENCGIVV